MKMNNVIKRLSALAVSALTLTALFSGCTDSIKAEKANQGEVQTLFDLENNVFIPDSNLMISEDEKYSFSLFSARFVSIYNQIMTDHPKCKIPDISKVEQTQDKTPYFEYDSYRCELKTASSAQYAPYITIYTPINNSSMYEMRLTFDGQNYTSEYYDIFRQMCLCTFRIMLPECPDSALTDLFEALYASAYDNDYTDGYKRPPVFLYRSKNVGLFSYYSDGSVNVSLIPLDELFFDSLVGNDVHIYDIATKKNYDSINSDDEDK